MIHYFPLEHVDARYTSHLDAAIRHHLSVSRSPRQIYYPEMADREQAPPPKGCFLNAPITCEFKARQLAMLSKSWGEGEVSSGDVLFFSDLWFPGLEMVRYLEHFTGIKVEVRGLLHAGSFTDTDSVRNLERWASLLENSWFDQIDKIFVGSEFMKEDLLRKRIVSKDRVFATGFPLDPALSQYEKTGTRKARVIFNGRDHPEKQPELWKKLEKILFEHDIETAWTQKLSLKKDDYYQLLSESSCVVSFALQENFGFGILEAVTLGCVPVVPNRLVYPEFFSKDYLYDTFDECVDKVLKAIQGKLRAPYFSTDFRESVVRWFK